MKIHAILNRDGGTLKTSDLTVLGTLIEDEFRLHGREAEIEVVAGDRLEAAIAAAAERSDLDAVLVGGGDGTVSCAAAALNGSKVAMAVLPAGTMNLYARTLQIPLGLTAAVQALANGHIVDVDIATVNGAPFVHQFAVGLHARMVRTRERLDYASRPGKMWATTKAIGTALRSLPLVELELEIDGARQFIRSPAVAVSNNLYGAGHLPFADDPKGGTLGVYICRTHDPITVARLALDVLRGTWRDNPALTVLQARTVTIRYAAGRKRAKRAVRDGELCDLEPESEVVVRPSRLKVLAPEDATYL